MRLVALLFLLLPISTAAATLAQRIEKILSQPAARRAFWGVEVLDLDSRQTLYQLNADRLFTPASNTKLFSTALALVRLGPNHRFLTRLAATSPPDADGRIAGDLVLVGGGDPNFSSRVLPYETQTEFLKNRLEPVDDLAAQVAELGVRRIDGDIVGDDTFFVWQRYPEGWAQDDTIHGDGAPVSALVMNDNTVTLRIRPGERVGDPAWLTVNPPAGYFTIDNRTRTVEPGVAARSIRIHREPGEQTLRVWGEIAVGDKGRAEILAIDDPALFAAQALRDALLRRSIVVLGRPVSRHAFPYEFADLAKGGPAETPGGEWVLASRSSMPLIEDLRVTNKISQNLHAELLLRAAARSRRGIGSIEASLAELKQFLLEAGIAPENFSFRDGSGLSRMNLVSPAAGVTLLAYMWDSPYRGQWLETLPLAAVDGTLRGRFVSTAAAVRLRGKTGTLSHVSALSGYLAPADGGHIAF